MRSVKPEEQNSQPEWTQCPLRVRYAETDQMGVVYHANYWYGLKSVAPISRRQRGFAYRDMEKNDGLCIIVAEARCRYHAPARYDDEMNARGSPDAPAGILTMIYRTDGELLAEGQTVHVITDLTDARAPPISTGSFQSGQ
jgi:acyl-CoA thioester hydrolase